MAIFTDAERAENIRLGQWAHEQLRTLDGVISYMEATPEDAWRVDTVRSADGSTNCFFGHLFNMGASDPEGSALWDAFESEWATTYAIYPVNDGSNPKYQQPTPRQRVLAYLYALRSGDELTTMQSMDLHFALSEAERASSGEQETAGPTHGDV